MKYASVLQIVAVADFLAAVKWLFNAYGLRRRIKLHLELIVMHIRYAPGAVNCDEIRYSA